MLDGHTSSARGGPELPFPAVLGEVPYKIPIIGLTANAFKNDIDECLSSGMNAVLSKPFEQQELLETIFRIVK